jgi:hypothetical protein
MKKIIPVFIVVLFLLQVHCTPGKKGPAQLWFFTYSNGGDIDSTLTPASFMDLQSDKTYSCDLGGFDSGHWEIKDSVLILRSLKNYIALFPIKYFFRNELSLRMGEATVLNFESQPARFSSAANNPFSVENNQWRITATRKESNPELKNRLKNHCKFYEFYFKWALDNDIKSIDVSGTPSLVKIYGNGFALKEYADLPAMWRSYFYDEEDCRKAGDILKNIFEHKDIAWAHTDSRYAMFISAFQQLQQLLK